MEIRDQLPERLIPLRRPPQVVVVEGRFVPQAVPLDAVDQAWEALRSGNPHLHDGPMLHVLGHGRNGHGGVTVHCIESSYRFHAVARAGLDTGLRPIGVKAVCFAPGGCVLMARRGERTLNYAGMWEFVPGGTLEPAVPPAEMVLRELCEETGWVAVAPPSPRALLFDPVVRSWEIVFAIDVRPAAVPVETWECAELRCVAPGEWPAPLAPAVRQMMPIVEAERRARAG